MQPSPHLWSCLHSSQEPGIRHHLLKDRQELLILLWCYTRADDSPLCAQLHTYRHLTCSDGLSLFSTHFLSFLNYLAMILLIHRSCLKIFQSSHKVCTLRVAHMAPCGKTPSHPLGFICPQDSSCIELLKIS